MFRAVILTCVAVIGFSAAATAQEALRWEPADGGNGHDYAFVDLDATFEEARALAEQTVHEGRRGYLVTLTSAAEQAFVTNVVAPGGAPYWLGAVEAAPGDWRWRGAEAGTRFGPGAVDGDGYSNWSYGEPDYQAEDGARIERGAAFAIANWSGDRWADASAEARYPYVIEFGGREPVEETTAPAGSGLIAQYWPFAVLIALIGLWMFMRARMASRG